MLLELQISDFAIIEHLHIKLEGGLTVLTGETGAGKSIIIDALGTLRGEKVNTSFVRAGCSRARVEGIFSPADCSNLILLLQEHGLWEEGDEHIILTREISAESGRSVARINGRAVNTTLLREVGERLVDIHSQHESISLFNTRTHLDMLDRYGGLLPLREQVATRFTVLRQLREELAQLQRSEHQRQQRLKELHFLIEDVQNAKLRLDEEQDLIQQRTVLQNAARITELVHAAYTALYQGDENAYKVKKPIFETMAAVTDDLNELARLDPSATPLAEQATDLHYRLEDLSINLRTYHSHLDFDPRHLEDIEDRLALIRSLQRKYNTDVAEILNRATQAEEEIKQLEHSSERIAQLEEQKQKLLAELGKEAAELSLRRRITGELLSQDIEAAMEDLALPYVKFAVDIAQTLDPQGVPVEWKQRNIQSGGDELHTKHPAKQTYQVTPTGIDRVEFLISPNPGEPLKPLVRIASGGESARVLLAIKSILSRVDMIPTLIFDEIDVGVGGRAGQVVGQKLWAMTDHHQVICITHLPQVAAFGDTHYAIRKEIVETPDRGALRTRTQLWNLNRDERIDELAAMLDGTPISEHSRASAREIIERANTFKIGDKTSCSGTLL